VTGDAGAGGDNVDATAGQYGSFDPKTVPGVNATLPLIAFAALCVASK
jgi:hypothetical protein